MFEVLSEKAGDECFQGYDIKHFLTILSYSLTCFPGWEHKGEFSSSQYQIYAKHYETVEPSKSDNWDDAAQNIVALSEQTTSILLLKLVKREKANENYSDLNW